MMATSSFICEFAEQVVKAMVEHVVLFKWQDDATPEAIESVGQSILALKDKIPGVIDLAYGEDFTKTRSQGFTHALVVRMANKDVVAFYDAHPEHVKVITQIRTIVDKILAVDFESPRHTPN
ncbi:hypothetical protein H257_02782 [Aphanomyces astaci]|uniref:Stress-response A/B barrel domain-containing protein n=2 Tax=Aphanomyces astaci TaxID=112090 RepID=W4H566_APHAT|nr:hypothetical protein H257_02782 [Aphanomyces astaci]ETV86409.1 hypothetical protein H257_02782 [Aphanomyces astaci]|eukprot:XP_009824881.1 hypothetical protein H257_02782 [Aphanomyces astaci]